MKQKDFNISRRKFITHLPAGIGYAALAFSAIDIIQAQGQPAPRISSRQHQKKLGVALVGLGQYATEQLAPALQQTQHCELRGIVTGSPDKAERWKKKYKIQDKNVYSYQDFDTIKDNPDIDIVYVVLPNAMHAEYTIRAAKAGKHVICEKPMAVSVKECEDMIKACKDANRLLSIGYRLHFDPFNMSMSTFGTEKTYGGVKTIVAEDAQQMEPHVWRLKKSLAGGGPVMDLGIYCVQGALYIMGENPIAVTAQEGPKTDASRFTDVEQSMQFQLHFANGAVANCYTSYDDQKNLLRAEAERGWFQLQPAYPYKGIKGETSQGRLDLPNVPQQVFQMDDFAKCVVENKQSIVPGEMGLRDVKILMAIYEAAAKKQKVSLSNL
jgi:predicted dehydrogenase